LDPSYAAAKLRLGFILGRRGGTEDLALALSAFSEAEKLYSAASDYEGVTETLLQRANLLNRRSRAQEAMPVIEQALSVARTVGNRFQEIRLQLLKGVAFRSLGNIASAGDMAQQAVDAALAESMDNLATSGLIDLGNTYLVEGNLESAEPYFKRALEAAQRGKVRRNEARARLSLGSLCEQDHRPEEARQFIETSLAFYRQSGYRRESVQAATLLGSVLRQLGENDEGIRVLNEVLPNAIQLQDRPVEAQLRERIAENLRDRGDWPEALTQYQQTATLFGPVLQAEYTRMDSAGLQSRLNRREDAEHSLAVARQFEARTTSRRLLSLIKYREAEMAYIDARFDAARQLAREALPGVGDERAQRDLALLQVLILIRSGQNSRALESAASLVEELDRTKLVGDAAVARLSIAEALALTGGYQEAAMEMAHKALDFFETKRNWETVWRGRLVAARVSHDRADVEAHLTASRSALAQLRTAWTAATVDLYVLRPDIRLLVGSQSF
jgi:tetratricopeptide (TPR) repeat protein